MYIISNEELLRNLTSRKTLNSLSGIPKKCYRYSLVAIFINVLSGRNYSKDQKQNVFIAQDILAKPKMYKDKEILNKIEGYVQGFLKRKEVKDSFNEQTITKIIELFREVLEDSQHQKTSMKTVKELNSIFDINRMYKDTHKNIQPHHWINIDLKDGMIPTFPEFIIYSDLINIWNLLLKKFEEIEALSIKNSAPDFYSNLKSNGDYRKLKYEADALSRSLWTLSVTFAESYLYYVFYNFKSTNYTSTDISVNKFLKNKKVEDTEIIKRFILKEFVTNQPEINRLLKLYEEINLIRNRFIHPSAFSDESNSTSELLPLITINYGELVQALDTCKQLVVTIDSNLPENMKILTWWDAVKHPDFLSYKPGNMIKK